MNTQDRNVVKSFVIAFCIFRSQLSKGSRENGDQEKEFGTQLKFDCLTQRKKECSESGDLASQQQQEGMMSKHTKTPGEEQKNVVNTSCRRRGLGGVGENNSVMSFLAQTSVEQERYVIQNSAIARICFLNTSSSFCGPHVGTPTGDPTREICKQFACDTGSGGKMQSFVSVRSSAERSQGKSEAHT